MPSPKTLATLSSALVLGCWSLAHGQSYTPAVQTTFSADPALILDYPDPRCTDDPGCTDDRLVQITIRYPDGVVGPSPVAVWSHGGAGGNNLDSGNDHSSNSLHEW